MIEVLVGLTPRHLTCIVGLCVRSAETIPLPRYNVAAAPVKSPTGYRGPSVAYPDTKFYTRGIPPHVCKYPLGPEVVREMIGRHGFRRVTYSFGPQ